MSTTKYNINRYKEYNQTLKDIRKQRQEAIKEVERELGKYIIKHYPIKERKRNTSNTDWKKDRNGNVKTYPKRIYTPKDFLKHYNVVPKN